MRNDRLTASLPALPWEHATEWLVQWPLVLFAAWWDLFLCPGAAQCRTGKPPSHDLAVPEPIEQEGEHALFA